MTTMQADLDAAVGNIERPHIEWAALILQTKDRDALFDFAKHISISNKLRESDRASLHKAIAQRMSCTVKALLSDLTRAMDGDDAEGELDDRDLARATLDESLVFAADGFYLWRESGVWAPAHEREIRKRIGDVLKSNGLPVKDRAVAAVANVLKDEAYDTGIKFDEPQANRVNVSNGTLQLVGSTWTLREHRREDYLSSQLPVSYDPDATCPRFDQFLQEIFSGDKDAADKALLIREMIGYTLLQSCHHERFICLIGGGCNGKSILLKTLQGLLGPDAYSAVAPADLKHDTSRLMIKGKLANIVPELPAGSMLADDAMKAFTSGEATNAKRLYADKVTLKPFATLWLGTNNLPHSRDLSRGMFRRAILVRFNQSFEGKADVALTDKLLKELPGILTAACKAYAGVVDRGGFTIPESCNKEVKSWRLACDQVGQWADECCTVGSKRGNKGPEVSHKEAYKAFRDWALDMGIGHPVSGKEFTARLPALEVADDYVPVESYRGKVAGECGTQSGFRHLLLSPPE